MRSPAGGSLDNEPEAPREEHTVTSRTTRLTTHTLDVPGATLTVSLATAAQTASWMRQ